MNSKHFQGKRAVFLFLILFLLVTAGGYALAQEAAVGGTARHASTDAGSAKQNITVARNGYAEHWQAMQDKGASPVRALDLDVSLKLPVAASTFSTQSLTGSDACSQIIVNPGLDIVELGDGTGTSEPWVFLEPYLYYINGNDDNDLFQDWAFDGYSLVFQDGDVGDPSPQIDMFGQGFLMPENLTDVTVEYWRASVDGNENDEVWGELWLLDEQGYLHLDDPDTYLVGYWDVYESELQWNAETITATEEGVDLLSGQLAALIFYNLTDGSAPDAPESEKEWMLMDDITLTACYKPQEVTGKQVYLPSVSTAGEVQPVCEPPTENPRDQYNDHRGFTQTNATCNSTLSNLDTADYYSYIPIDDGEHILHLQDLPPNSEWSAMIFTDEAQPKFAPGDGDGDCRITKGGSENKFVTCDLQKDKKYFIKVSAGSTPLADDYVMKVVTP
ncbi:MAG: hypothetical protein ACK2UK_18635 [Candidatus Promineifilaceae bacterium]